VYTPAKVGSSSIYYSLVSQYSGIVTKGHNFFQKIDQEYDVGGAPRSLNPSKRVKVWSSQIVQLYKHSIIKKKKLFVITSIRDPFSRNMSAFFDNFERDVGIPFNQSTFGLNELKDKFLSCNTGGNYHFWILDWFEDHINNHFGIDVYSKLFPKNGYCHYTNKNIELLVIKLEIPNEMKEKAIKEVIGLKSFQLNVKANIGKQKEYAEVYRDFKSKMKFPNDYLEKITKSKFLNHFYSKDEINAMIKRWGN